MRPLIGASHALPATNRAKGLRYLSRTTAEKRKRKSGAADGSLAYP